MAVPRPWACWLPAPRSCGPLCGRPHRRGHAFVALDGTLILIDQVAADRPFYPRQAPQASDACRSSTALPTGSCGCQASCPVSSMTDHGMDLRHQPRRRPLPDKSRSLARTTSAQVSQCSPHTAGGVSPPRRRTPTGPHAWLSTPASEPTSSSSAGRSCANCAAVPGAPDSFAKAIHLVQAAKSEDEKGSVRPLARTDRAAMMKPGSTLVR